MIRSLSLPQAMSEQQKAHIEQTIYQEKNRLFSFIRQRVPKLEDAEDILQDVFYQLIAAYESIESLEKTSSWLFTVARNKITDRYRKKKAIPFSESQGSISENDEKTPSLEDILPDLSNHPDEVLLRSMIWEAIEEALEELPQEQREVFVMHEFEDYSFKEIAEIKGVSVNTLLSRKRYAVLNLRKYLVEIYRELF
ncbi:MAG: RNA polymerase sigma factor [Microscillaceae bacterium]|nr:RNA polymerase sigma factor [Microscillaceae bacterium]